MTKRRRLILGAVLAAAAFGLALFTAVHHPRVQQRVFERLAGRIAETTGLQLSEQITGR